MGEVPAGGDSDPLILTLALDAVAFARFDALRRTHFPTRLNQVPAHLTLFHNLPGEVLGEVVHELRAVAAGTGPLPLRVTGLRHMGRGVAYDLASSEVSALRRRLAERWAAWLKPQDLHPWRPHVTVQNKVLPEEAKALRDRLLAGFTPWDVSATGLLLWHYRGGPWEAAADIAFRA